MNQIESKEIQFPTANHDWKARYGLEQSAGDDNEGLTFDDFWQSLRAAFWLGMTFPFAILLVTRAGDLMEVYPTMAIVSGVVAFAASLFVRATENTRDGFVMLLRTLAYCVLGVQFLGFLVAIGFYVANKG